MFFSVQPTSRLLSTLSTSHSPDPPGSYMALGGPLGPYLAQTETSKVCVNEQTCKK